MTTIPTDAIDQLTADHAKVKDLFDQFESIKTTGSTDDKQSLVAHIVSELEVHESVENDVFFPAVRDVLRTKEVLETAGLEQEDAGDAIKALSELAPGEAGYAEKVTQFGQEIAAHAAEEESEVFPKIRQSQIDTAQLGEEMAARKAELIHNSKE